MVLLCPRRSNFTSYRPKKTDTKRKSVCHNTVSFISHAVNNNDAYKNYNDVQVHVIFVLSFLQQQQPAVVAAAVLAKAGAVAATFCGSLQYVEVMLLLVLRPCSCMLSGCSASLQSCRRSTTSLPMPKNRLLYTMFANMS